MLKCLPVLLVFVLCGFTQEAEPEPPPPVTDTTDGTIKRYKDGESLAADFVTLHTDPKAGQYWETGSDSDGITSSTRWQITKIKGDIALVERRMTVKAELFKSDYVLAYRVNLKAEAGKPNVTRAWVGKLDEAPTKIKVRESKAVPAKAEGDEKGEAFDGLELAGGVWHGKLYSREFEDMTVSLWIAEGGWFDAIVQTKAGDFRELLKQYGGDGDPMMFWPDEESWAAED